MKTNELRNKSVEELKNELSGLQREQFNLRFQLKTGSLSNTDSVRVVRRNIARVNTILAQKIRAQGDK